MDLGRLEVVPEDAAGRSYWRSTSITARGVAIRSTGRSCSVAAGARAGSGSGARWSRRGVVVDLARRRSEPVLEVGEAAALADPRAAEVDGDRAAEHEVDLRQLLDGDHPPVAQRALDRRRLAHLLARACADRGGGTGAGRAGAAPPSRPSCPPRARAARAWVWGESGLALITLGALPEPVAGELLGGQLGAGEVRDPALGAREARDALAVHRLPDRLANLVLGAHPGDGSAPPPRALPNADERSHLAERVARPDDRRPTLRSGAPLPSACASCCPRSSPSAGSTTGAARSASRASSTRPWSSSSTATGSGPRSRGSRTSPPRAARCWSPTTPARCRRTRR